MRRLPLTALAAALLVVALSASVALAAKRSDGSKPLPASIANPVLNVPQETLDQIGRGKVLGAAEFAVTPLGGSASAAGKVHVISYNAAWCPHCAANSWPLAVALSHFGTLTGLRQIDTGTYFEKVVKAKPAYSHTKGLSFIDASYESTLVKFEPVVAFDLQGQKLNSLNGAQKSVVKSFDPELGFPAVAIGDDWGLYGSGLSPGLLAGKSTAEIAKSLADPKSPIAKAIDGEANLITAAICTATGNQPEEVCTSPAIMKASKNLPKS